MPFLSLSGLFCVRSASDHHDNLSVYLGALRLQNLALAGGESLFLQELAELVVYSLDVVDQPVEQKDVY